MIVDCFFSVRFSDLICLERLLILLPAVGSVIVVRGVIGFDRFEDAVHFLGNSTETELELVLQQKKFYYFYQAIWSQNAFYTINFLLNRFASEFQRRKTAS